MTVYLPLPACSDPQDPEGRVCNGQGTCNCGSCQCDPVSQRLSYLYSGIFVKWKLWDLQEEVSNLQQFDLYYHYDLRSCLLCPEYVNALLSVEFCIFFIWQTEEDPSLRYEGPYCQFNPQNCPLARDANGNFRPCAGRSHIAVNYCYPWNKVYLKVPPLKWDIPLVLFSAWYFHYCF